MSRIQGNAYDPADGMEDGAAEQSGTRREADARKAAYAYRMPVIQTAGLLDGVRPIERAEDDGRFLCHRWFTEDEGHAPLYQLLPAKRCPHALDIRTAGIAWEFLKRFSRNGDGSLNVRE